MSDPNLSWKTIIITTILATALVVGCGPSAQQQFRTRVCEMYKDVGGGKETTHDYWIDHFNTPDELAKIAARNAVLADTISKGLVSLQTVQSRAHEQHEHGKDINDRALGIVSLRLSISIREVNEALATCFPKVEEPVKTVSPAPKAVIPVKEDLPDAAAAEQRTTELLQRTEGLVTKSASIVPKKRGIVFGTAFTTTSDNKPVILEERKVFSPGGKFAFVAEIRSADR